MAIAKRLISGLLAMLIAYMPGPVWAFYGHVTPGGGWRPGVAGSLASYSKAAGEHVVNGAIKSSAMLNVGGQAVKMGVSYKLSSAAAARVAAAVIFSHPALRLGLAAAAWLGLAKMTWDSVKGVWTHQEEDPDPITTREYRFFTWTRSLSSACNEYIAHWNSDKGAYGKRYSLSGVRVADATCLIHYHGVYEGGFVWTDGDTTMGMEYRDTGVCPDGAAPGAGGSCGMGTLREITDPEEYKSIVTVQPMPQGVPEELPESTPWPVESPTLNPGPDGLPKPLRIPTGDPVPTADPAKWKQPWVEVTPSSTIDDPWRVDVKPGETLQDSPTPMPDPYTPDPTPDPNDTTKPDEQLDLCEKHPDILACQKIDLGTLDPQEVPDDKKTITMTPDAGWGRAGSCPAPRTVNLHGGMALSIPLDLMCDFATMIRPLIVAAAYLGAAMMLVGAARKD